MYIYQAALYCDECGKHIKRRLKKEGVVQKLTELGVDINDEYTFDSGEYPKYCQNSESDCPEHCDGCGVFLENPLTSDGYEYIKELLKEAEKKNYISEPLKDWAEFYGLNYEQ